jgi:hypothetical protein
MTPLRSGRFKSEKEQRELADMAAAVARYQGPITYCRPGVARGHETKVTYESMPRPPESRAER